jgi:hypothetical protein
MSRLEIFCVDRRQRILEGCAELSRLNQRGDFVEKLPLDGHVRCLVHRAREHARMLPLVLEQIQVERLGIFHNGNDTSLRADDIRHDVPVCVGVAEVCEEVHYLAPKRKQLAGTG